MILVDQTSLNGTFSVHLDFKTVAPFFHLPFKQAFSLWRVFKFFLNMNENLTMRDESKSNAVYDSANFGKSKSR